MDLLNQTNLVKRKPKRRGVVIGIIPAESSDETQTTLKTE
jgi:hypothetical protein